VQAIVFERDVELTGGAENFDRQSVKEFVGEDDEGSVGNQTAMNVSRRGASPRWTAVGGCPRESDAKVF